MEDSSLLQSVQSSEDIGRIGPNENGTFVMIMSFWQSCFDHMIFNYLFCFQHKQILYGVVHFMYGVQDRHQSACQSHNSMSIAERVQASSSLLTLAFSVVSMCLCVFLRSTGWSLWTTDLKFSARIKEHHISDDFEGQDRRSKVKVTRVKNFQPC